MRPVPKNRWEALAICRDPSFEDCGRDYAAMKIGELDEALPDLAAVARNLEASPMLQQRAAGCLANAWRDRGMPMDGDLSCFMPALLDEIALDRAADTNR
jgi:hypothetical protein